MVSLDLDIGYLTIKIINNLKKNNVFLTEISGVF